MYIPPEEKARVIAAAALGEDPSFEFGWSSACGIFDFAHQIKWPGLGFATPDRLVFVGDRASTIDDYLPMHGSPLLIKKADRLVVDDRLVVIDLGQLSLAGFTPRWYQVNTTLQLCREDHELVAPKGRLRKLVRLIESRR